MQLPDPAQLLVALRAKNRRRSNTVNLRCKKCGFWCRTSIKWATVYPATLKRCGCGNILTSDLDPSIYIWRAGIKQANQEEEQ